MRSAHGATMAKQSKTILRGALQLAVMASVLSANPVRDVQPLQSKNQPKGAMALRADQLPELLAKLRASAYCRDQDLVDPITMLIAPGCGAQNCSAALGRHRHAAAPRPSTQAGAGRGRGAEVDSRHQSRRAPHASAPQFAIEMLTARREVPYSASSR